MRGSKILITGPTGQVATPVAKALAADNEVWGIARFTNPAVREDLEKAGVRCQTVNLAAGDFTGLPNDFDYVLNLAVAKSGNWDKDLAANAESVGLLMAHCRDAKAFLHCSSGAVYDPPDDELRTERRRVGRQPQAACFPPIPSPRSPARSSLATMARALGVPTTIARLNVPYGDNGGWPFYPHGDDAGRYSDPRPARRARPLQPRSTRTTSSRTIPKLLEVASVPATTAQLVRRPGRQPAGLVHLPRLTGRQGAGIRGERASAARQSHRRQRACASSSAPRRSTGATVCAGWRPSSIPDLVGA